MQVKMLKIWNKINQKCTFVLGIVGLIGILVATAGVITRFIFKISIAWSDELLRTIFVWGYFIGAAFCFEEGGIMRLELVEDFLKKHHKAAAHKVLAVISDVINLVFFAGSTYYVYEICAMHIARGTTSGTSSTPAWVLPASYGVCCALIAVIAVRNLIRDIREPSVDIPDHTADMED